MNYDQLFSILDTSNTNKVSCEQFCKQEKTIKYLYYASKENFDKKINNNLLHEEFIISDSPGRATCKLISLESINNKYFPGKDFVFQKSIGYSQWNEPVSIMRKPLKKVEVFVKSDEDFNINDIFSEEGYMYCISKEEFNSDKQYIPYVKKYKISVNYTIKGVK